MFTRSKLRSKVNSLPEVKLTDSGQLFQNLDRRLGATTTLLRGL